MRKLKLLFGFVFVGVLAASCYTEVFIEDDYIIEETRFNVNQVLASSELWYVDINATIGNGEIPFLQRAFTVTFDGGVLLANNNLSGIGKTGNGFGIDVGTYNGFDGIVEINHDIDGSWVLGVFVVNSKTIELYDSRSDTSYFLKGYQRSNFDYDMVFYDNIQYFLQEYDAWEKVYTSNEGALNDFDNENFLQFLTGNQSDFFRSSIDNRGTGINTLQWDFEGDYQVYDVANDNSLKVLTLSYDFIGDDYFELYVINDKTIELYHPNSGTTYEFKGRGYIQYLKTDENATTRKRIKVDNPIMNVTRKKK
ncbi:nicotinic acid mononucleotide adenyltransferase [Cellulophaga sp. HaHaR_3_176]|uniref:nicotinic acid mononucleotide adenyltransferase n=1 Tax=Cellulophaga sp. HaHaR_3_176 TaxID=1942464 RepID=UPI001C1F40B7|nr:nicotinic acid mononucleotide adenyltransferase [Cellulophaga sp. HaHaR_3_176]QWX83409.1 nicotinic acid mononucleotide adenyltransferase [Cellulophaga sp. HaHaR_3_176]